MLKRLMLVLVVIRVLYPCDKAQSSSQGSKTPYAKEMAMDLFPYLETEAFIAYIADNSPIGIHRGGYNGVASLIPRHSGNNLFVPMYAGLNYETISLTGLSPYRHSSGSKFEPRCEPMYIEHADRERVVLVQPETSHAHVSARITFSVEEPYYLHQNIQLTFHSRFCAPEEKSRFRSLWASYMHGPPDRHIYLKPDPQAGGDLDGWVGITKADHRGPIEIRFLPGDRELSAIEHLEVMGAQDSLVCEPVSRATDVSPEDVCERIQEGPLTFYYGFCHGSQLFLMMFKQPAQFRLAYSPCGAGKEPFWNPAWDYVLHLEDAAVGSTYTWDLCVAIKPFSGRADVLHEVRRYLGSDF